jgi:hypothetical protein
MMEQRIKQAGDAARVKDMCFGGGEADGQL